MTTRNGKAVPPETSAGPQGPSPMAGQAMGEDDDTVVVVRKPRKPSLQSTPTVRPADAKDAAGDAANERTVVVAKRAKATPSTPTPSTPTPSTPTPTPRTSRRRGITPPPGPLGLAPQAIESAGANATDTYRPRAVPAPPPLRAPLPEGPAATRDAAASLPSVARQSRITARAALVAFGLACAASVIGLTLIVIAYLRAR